jgi:DNA-binding XRE family transcriptional regulator
MGRARGEGRPTTVAPPGGADAMSEGEQYLRRVGLRIKCLRTLHAVSQDWLADKAQVSRVTLGSIGEASMRPTC